jgi:hypothetical protein
MQAVAEQVSYERDIRPLFRDRDVNSMSFAFDLASYDDVRANAQAIYEKLADGSMPCDGRVGGFASDPSAIADRHLRTLSKRLMSRSRSLRSVLVVAAEPDAFLVPPLRRAVEPLVHPPEPVQPARVC